MKELGFINPREVTAEEAVTFSLREAARAVVLDDNGLIALLHVTRDAYYKLPGGGLEGEEDKLVALERECLEEIGCSVEVIREIGYTTEYWKEDTEKQISYCYLAKLSGEKGAPSLTDSERERGFQTVWLSYEDAVSVFEQSNPADFEGEYIVPRELIFLREAKKFLP